ncbi:MAG: signal peptidase II [Planctomycetota bacterium]
MALPERIVSADKHLARIGLALALAAVGCVADLWSKRFMFGWLGGPPSQIWWIWEGYAGFETSINTGGLFGIGQGGVFWLAIVSIGATIGLLIWLVRGEVTRSLLLTVAVGMILGGVLGNLYDRLGLWGIAGVRDWILLRYGTFTWPNFNIADSLLVCGAVILGIFAFKQPHAPSQVDDG